MPKAVRLVPCPVIFAVGRTVRALETKARTVRPTPHRLRPFSDGRLSVIKPPFLRFSRLLRNISY